MIRYPESLVAQQSLFLAVEMILERDRLHVVTAETNQVMPMTSGEFK